MNKDRIQGSVAQAKGKVKEVAGKVTGDAKLETKGKTQETAGKIQNAVSGFKDAVKEAVNDYWSPPSQCEAASVGGLFIFEPQVRRLLLHLAEIDQPLLPSLILWLHALMCSHGAGATPKRTSAIWASWIG